MRQLGARLPELPPVQTDVETPSEIQPHERHPVEAPEPYPVEVHRIERHPAEPAPVETSPPLRERMAAMQAGPEPIAEPPAETQRLPDAGAEPVGAAQTPSEPIGGIVAPQASPETDAESAAPVAQAPPRIIEPPIAETKAPVPMADSAAVSDVLPAPVATAEQVVPAPSPEPAALRITEAPINRAEQPISRPAEPGPERPPDSRRALRPTPDIAQELPEPNLSGRWAEFHDFRRIEPGRGSRINLDPTAPYQLPPPRLLASDREPEHRSSFLTIAVPGIAAILAVGALLWSGSLRDRVLRQDAEMTALQQQNRKLADALAQMNVDQKVVGALNASGSAPTNAPDQTTQNPANSPAEPTQPSGKANTLAANANGVPAPAPKQAAPSAGKREGVSVPPSIESTQRRGSHKPADTGYHPEIVPPYPTLSQSQSPAQAKSSSSAPVQQAYHAPLPANSSASPAAPSATPARTTQSSAAPPSPAPGANPTTSYGIGSSPAYSATGSGAYATALAQNIEAVETLQRQSQVPLREFHARDGVSVKITPGLFISLRSPDQAHATYALMVSGSSGNYQLRGHLNSPLRFSDNATHLGYELVILRIAGQEAYGYVRPVQ